MAFDAVPAWFEAEPTRLQWELERFAEHGLPAAQHVTALGAELGDPRRALYIDTELSYEGERVRVTVVFPDDYPEAPPDFFAPAGLLERHQYPGEQSLCWSADPDRDWHPGRDAAYIVAHNLRELFAASEQGPDAVHAGEADMAEPLSGFIQYDTSRVVVVPEPFLAEQLPAHRGKLKLLRDGSRLFLNSAEGVGAADGSLQRRFIPRGKEDRRGYWVELAPPPRAQAFNGREPWDLRQVAPELCQRMAAKACAQRSPTTAWLGVTFMEQGPTRGQTRRNWAFGLVSFGPAGDLTGVRWFAAQALTQPERQRRTPELIGLEHARVLIVGAGSLGSPLTFELAKAGVERLTVIDPDSFDVNNSVRHVLPVTYAGWNKAEAVAENARLLNPFAAVVPHAFLVKGGGPNARTLRQLIEDAAVVVDTTGSNTAVRVLQRLCIAAPRPLVVVGLTGGGYGGSIRVGRPGGACFDCMLLHEQDGVIPRAAAAPPTALVTPAGCSHPTFTGAGFDATQLAAAVARATIQTTGLSGYPSATYNWAVANFRTEPAWRSGHVSQHPDCWRHA
jgi:molybdopterin/thiamine biosynthesis adenylyltransferase